jgi:hypothetical protein
MIFFFVANFRHFVQKINLKKGILPQKIHVVQEIRQKSAQLPTTT